MMTNNAAATFSGPEPDVAAAEPTVAEPIIVNTRFGRLEFDPAQSIAMPRGMMGFPDDKVFALTSKYDTAISQWLENVDPDANSYFK